MTYLITYGSGALNTISCEVLWTGRGESWAENYALSENQWVFELGARISSFALIVGQQFLEFTRPLTRHADDTAREFHSKKDEALCQWLQTC